MEAKIENKSKHTLLPWDPPILTYGFKPPNKRERVCSLSSLTNSIVKRSFFLTTSLSLFFFFFLFFWISLSLSFSLSLFKTSINKKNPKKRKKKKEKRSKPLLSINSFSNDNEALTRYGHFFSVLSLFFSLPRSLSLSLFYLFRHQITKYS